MSSQPNDMTSKQKSFARTSSHNGPTRTNSVLSASSSMLEPFLADRHVSSLMPIQNRLITGELSYQSLLDADDRHHKWVRIKREAKRLTSLALPIATQNLLAFSFSLVSVSFIGHLGKYELSVAILATSLYNLMGNSICQGLAGGMETLCGQAYGAGSYRQLGIVLQRALLIVLTCCIVVAGLWSQAERALLALGQAPELAAGAGRYITLITPALFLSAMCECLKRYLMAQGVVTPALAVTFVTVFLAPVYNWLFIHYLSMGLDGAALAFVALQATIGLALLIYILIRDACLRNHPKQTFHGLSCEAFQGWGQYLGLAVPSMAMVCLEWWVFEAVIMLAGWLPDPQVCVSVMGICMNIISLIYMIPLGLGAATSTRVSNYLGADHADDARLSARIAIAICFVLTTVTCAIVVALRDKMAYLFTSEKTVVEHTATVLPILAAALLGDAIMATLAGVLRGCGRQVVGAVLNAIAYWCVGFPLAYALAFKAGWGTQGLWTGLATVTTLQACVIGGYVASINWSQEAEKAVLRVQTLKEITKDDDGLYVPPDPESVPVPANGISNGSQGLPIVRVYDYNDSDEEDYHSAVGSMISRSYGSALSNGSHK